jgi:hypothetical protein
MSKKSWNLFLVFIAFMTLLNAIFTKNPIAAGVICLSAGVFFSCVRWDEIFPSKKCGYKMKLKFYKEDKSNTELELIEEFSITPNMQIPAKDDFVFINGIRYKVVARMFIPAINAITISLGE